MGALSGGCGVATTISGSRRSTFSSGDGGGGSAIIISSYVGKSSKHGIEANKASNSWAAAFSSVSASCVFVSGRFLAGFLVNLAERTASWFTFLLPFLLVLCLAGRFFSGHERFPYSQDVLIVTDIGNLDVIKCVDKGRITAVNDLES